jgi:hypothetical protein
MFLFPVWNRLRMNIVLISRMNSVLFFQADEGERSRMKIYPDVSPGSIPLPWY